MPNVSIIIRTKNEERWIGSCLEAVFNQKYKDFEVILVDNQSTDQTITKAKKYPIRLVTIKDFLPGKAINKGILKSKGKIIVIISGHCIPVSNKWLENLIHDLKDPKVAGVYGRQQPMSFSSDNDKRDLITVFGLDKKVQKKDPFFHNANSAVRKEILKKISFDEKATNIEDRIWGMKVIKAGYQIIYEPSASVYHYHGINQNMDPVRSRNVVRILEQIDQKKSKKNNKYLASFDAKALKITALIPAKGPPELCGKKPLLFYTIKRALEAKYVNRVIALCDNKKTAAICRDAGAETPFMRPKNLSSTYSTVNDLLKFSIGKLNEMKYFPDICVVLQKNYPFRQPGFIDDIVERFVREGADCMMPMKEEGRAIWKKSKDLIENISPLMPRKLKKDQFMVSHFGLGFVTHASFLCDGSLGLNKKVCMYPVSDFINTLEVRRKETLSSVAPIIEKYWQK